MIHRRLITKGIKYYITLPHNTGHGIHSPFLFRLISEVFTRNLSNADRDKIGIYRDILYNNHSKINIIDLGAQSIKTNRSRKVKDIALRESVSDHYGRLLYNLTAGFKPGIMLELGTSLGLGSLYLCLGNPDGKLFSLEGCSEKAFLALSMLQKIPCNIEVVEGSFEEKLTEVLSRAGRIDFAYIDGNHRKESTIRYFEQILKYCHGESVIVLDDINWSPGMMEAWQQIQQHNQVRVCLDLFRMGIVFLEPKLQKQNFTIFY